MDKNIETYVDQIVSQLNCSVEEKRDIIDEMKDHLYLLKTEYLEQGFTNEEASQKAIEKFGGQKQLTKGLQESLFPFYKVFRIGTWVIFALYSIIVVFKLLFQRIIFRITDYANAVSFGYPNFNRYFFYPPESNSFFDLEVWQFNSNVIPFQNIFFYLTRSDAFDQNAIFNNTLGNILIFLPLGIFLPILFRKYRSLSKIFVGSIMISLSIEVIQFILQVGQFDIDDIILNAIGSTIGFMIIKTLISVKYLLKRDVFRKTVS